MRVRVLSILVLLVFPGLSTVEAAGEKAYADTDRKIEISPDRGGRRRRGLPGAGPDRPLDDRNYELTREDLALLGENERELRTPIPAFFRVYLRREAGKRGFPSFDRYPLSALNVFRQNWGGYYLGGSYYRKAVRQDDRFFVRMDSVIEASPPAAETAGAGDFLEGEARVTTPNGAAESAIAISPVDTTKVVAGSNGPLGGQRMHYSQDGGKTWKQAPLPGGGTCCDPTVEWSSDGQFAYTATLGGCAPSASSGSTAPTTRGWTWTSFESDTPGDARREVTTSADREFMHVDQSPTSPFQDNVYLMWHQSNVMRLGRSNDFGNTWSTFVFSGNNANRGIAGDIATDRSGRLYYAWPAFFSRTIRLGISTDGGASFGPISVVASTNSAFSFPIPAVDSREVAVYIAADVDLTDGPFADSVYLVWTDNTGPDSSNPSNNHARVQVAYSRDGGSSWSISTPHETADQLSVDRWQPFIAVGEDGDRARHLLRHAKLQRAQRGGSVLLVLSRWRRHLEQSRAHHDRAVPEHQRRFRVRRLQRDGHRDERPDRHLHRQPQRDGGLGRFGRRLRRRDRSGWTRPRQRAQRIGHPRSALVLDRSGADITLDWTAACGGTTDYAVYEGEIGSFADKTSRLCSTGGATSATLTPSTGDRFYLVVPTGGDAEGSYGRASDGSERTPAETACQEQAIDACF